MADPADLTPPLAARWLDVAGIGLLLLGASMTISGGFREMTPLGRISVTSWERPLLLGTLLLLGRHWWWRRPGAGSRFLQALGQGWRSEAARAVWPVAISSRLAVLVVGFLGITLIGYAPGTPPYRVYNNDFLDMPARWDTGWYMGIATNGYSFDPAASGTMQNIAFFPMYPMLMRYLGLFAARQVIWVGVAISITAFLWATLYIFRLARTRLGDDAAAAGVGFLAVYPFALFFSAAYTESLFLLATVASCFHFERDQLAKAATWGLVAGLTRPNGCLLSVVLALMALRQWQTTSWQAMTARILSASAPGIGMLIFSAYIYFLTGTSFQWASQHGAWGRVYRGLDSLISDRVRYIEINGLYNYASTLSLDVLNSSAALFALASVWPVYRRLGMPYAAMILLNVLLPLTFGGVLSMGRVTAVMFPAFMWLGAAVPAAHRSGWLVGLAMLQAVCAIAFFTWRPLY